MSTNETIKSAFIYGHRPTPSHDYIEISNNGKCLTYRDRTNGEDLSLCVEQDSYDNWNTLWQTVVASKLPQSNYHATVRDFLNDEQRFGTTILGLSPEKSADRAYKRLAGLAEKNGIDPLNDLSPAERHAYLNARRSINENQELMFIAGGIAARCVWISAGILILGLMILKEIQDAQHDKERRDAALKTAGHQILCISGQKEDVLICKDLPITNTVGEINSVICNGKTYECDKVTTIPEYLRSSPNGLIEWIRLIRLAKEIRL